MNINIEKLTKEQEDGSMSNSDNVSVIGKLVSAPPGPDLIGEDLISNVKANSLNKNVHVIMKKKNDNVSENNDLREENKKQSLSLKKCIEKKIKGGKKRATKPTKVFKISEEMVDQILELENGLLAMTCVMEWQIRIFYYISGKLKMELPGHNDYIMGMISIPKSNQLISYSWDKDIKIWSAKYNFMLIKQIDRTGMINNLFMITPNLFLIEESQSETFFRHKKVTEVISMKSSVTLAKFDKNSGLGSWLGILEKTNTIMFNKHSESWVKFWKLQRGDMITTSLYKPRYDVKRWYELDETKIIATFRDIGMYVIYDYVNQTELYSLCPHSNDIINLSVREYVNFAAESPSVKRKLSAILNMDQEDETKMCDTIPDPILTKKKLSSQNKHKLIISGGKDRNIIVSDVVNMWKVGQITLKNCTSDGYKFIGLSKCEQVWVCMNNQYIYVYDLKQVFL